MTSQKIMARNRANARNSTGPRTGRGKAAIAGNARQHGATSRPTPESVATWLGIILDDPDVSPDALLPRDERGFRALALAEAEVRHVAAERALLDFERGVAEPSEDVNELRGMARLILQDLKEGGLSARKIRSGYSLISRIARFEFQETQQGGRRHRLLKRYLREARSRRRRALQAWIEATAPGEHGAWQRVEKSNSPEQSQYSI